MNLTTKEVAELIKGELEGDASVRLDGVAPLESAGPSRLSYLGDGKTMKLTAGCEAGCLLLPADMKGKEIPFSGVRIYVNNPQWAFTVILRQIQLERRSKVRLGIHPSAIVDPTARIGKYTSIGPLTVIEKGASVGDFTVIGAQCYLGENSSIGRNCLLYPQ
ncbi:MAG: LpxD N-terminal domain-containing protein, partial [bacterium]